MPGLVTYGPQCSLCLNNAAAVLITRTPIQRTVNTVQPCTLEVSEPGALCSPVVFGCRLSKLEEKAMLPPAKLTGCLYSTVSNELRETLQCTSQLSSIQVLFDRIPGYQCIMIK